MVDVWGAATRQKTLEFWEDDDSEWSRSRDSIPMASWRELVSVYVCVFQYTPAAKKWQ